MQEDFADIFGEYYAQFRGQASSIPVYGDREYTQGIRLGNSAIRKWERADGVIWRELMTLASLQNTTILPVANKTIVSGTTSYTAPTNMRKPPGKVRFYSGSSYHDVKVIEPYEVNDMAEDASYVVFYGGANTGFTMVITSGLSTQYNGWLVDYPYVKKATLLSTSADPSTTVPEMSDINFMIQEMLASRYANARNGFGYKTAKADSTAALRNMRTENDSGTYDSIDILKGASGWGSPSGNSSGITL